MNADTLIALASLYSSGGLVAGYVIPKLAIPRMGVTAHLVGTVNGTFLIVVGLIWDG